jgi:uncharacterized membrane protein SirB2
MDGYSEIDTIYFSVADKTSYAKYVPKLIDTLNGKYPEAKQYQEFQIKTGTYQGSPPYKPVEKPLPKLLKQYHAAEHQVYNCFLNKAKKLNSQASLREFQNFIPELEEAKRTTPFSFLCGTTILISSGILLMAAIPNILKLNSNLGFMVAWFISIIIFTSIVSYFIQKKFYLAQANDRQLILAIEALKEVLKDERDHTT